MKTLSQHFDFWVNIILLARVRLLLQQHYNVNEFSKSLFNPPLACYNEYLIRNPHLKYLNSLICDNI